MLTLFLYSPAIPTGSQSRYQVLLERLNTFYAYNLERGQFFFEFVLLWRTRLTHRLLILMSCCLYNLFILDPSSWTWWIVCFLLGFRLSLFALFAGCFTPFLQLIWLFIAISKFELWYLSTYIVFSLLPMAGFISQSNFQLNCFWNTNYYLFKVFPGISTICFPMGRIYYDGVVFQNDRKRLIIRGWPILVFLWLGKPARILRPTLQRTHSNAAVFSRFHSFNTVLSPRLHLFPFLGFFPICRFFQVSAGVHTDGICLPRLQHSIPKEISNRYISLQFRPAFTSLQLLQSRFEYTEIAGAFFFPFSTHPTFDILTPSSHRTPFCPFWFRILPVSAQITFWNRCKLRRTLLLMIAPPASILLVSLGLDRRLVRK